MARCLVPLSSLIRRFPVNGLGRVAWGWIAAALVLAGCASGPNWDQRVGHYSYDDAVREFGPPQGKEVLTDGTIVADWLTGTRRVFFGAGYGRRRWIGAGDISTTPESHLVLVFGADRRLQTFRHKYL